MENETLLATLPASRPDQRLLLVLSQVPGDGSRIELQQQSWGEGVGWFTQSRIQLEPEQLRGIRGVLGTTQLGGSRVSRPASVPATLPFPGAVQESA